MCIRDSYNVGGNTRKGEITANGTYTDSVVSDSGALLFFQSDQSLGFVGSIDNVSVKEVFNADFDFTRGSSATRVGSNGLIQTVASGLPRIDYSGGVGHILTEPERTNLETKSNGFSTWVLVSNVTRTADYTLSPEGVSNATRLQFTSNGFVANSTITSGTEYTVSVYAKRNDTGIQSFGFFVDGSGAVNSEMSLTSEWERFSFNHTATNGSYVGLAGLSGADVSVYGFQVEQASYPTSYIVSNSGSATTRLGETLNNSGSADLINSTEGVLMAETKGENDGTFNYISLSDGNTSNYVGILYTDEDNQITYRYYVGGSGVQLIIDDIIVTNFNKIAVKWKINDFAIWINGYEVGTASSGGLNPSGTFNELAFARGGSNNTPFYGKTKCVAVFKEALSDLELECLTSWMSFADMGIALGYTIE